jgi:hypothetical protein
MAAVHTFFVLAFFTAGFLIVPVSASLDSWWGYYYIQSIPSDADCYFDGEFKGRTPISVAVTGLPDLTHTYSIRAPWYDEFTGTANGSQSFWDTITLPTAVLTPGDPPGSIQVTSVPSGVTAFLENAQKGTTPCTFTNVTPGPHVVYVYCDFYEEWFTNVEVSSDSIISVDAHLEPWPTTVAFHVSTSPAGAEIYLDDIVRGTTPATIDVDEGRHSVVLTREGYRDFVWLDLDFDPALETDKYLTETLTPLPPATVYVSSTPSGAMVYSDGVLVGRTPDKTPLVLADILPGNHTLLLNRPGYRTYTTNYTVQQDQEYVVSVTLEPFPPVIPGVSIPNPGYDPDVPSGEGSVYVSSYPSDTIILVNGTERGYTNQVIRNISAGKQNLTFTSPGYESYSTEVTVFADQTTVVPFIILMKGDGEGEREAGEESTWRALTRIRDIQAETCARKDLGWSTLKETVWDR